MKRLIVDLGFSYEEAPVIFVYPEPGRGRPLQVVSGTFKLSENVALFLGRANEYIKALSIIEYNGRPHVVAGFIDGGGYLNRFRVVGYPATESDVELFMGRGVPPVPYAEPVGLLRAVAEFGAKRPEYAPHLLYGLARMDFESVRRCLEAEGYEF